MNAVLLDIETTAIGNKKPKIWLAWTLDVSGRDLDGYALVLHQLQQF